MCAFLFDLAGQILKVPFPLAGVEGVVGGDNESIVLDGQIAFQATAEGLGQMS